MKGTKHYLFGMMLITLLTTCIGALCCLAGLAGIREESFRFQLGMAAAVREKYPELSEKEILQSLTAPASSEALDETRRRLRNYGMTEDAWSHQPEEGYAAGVALGGILFCLLTGAGGALVLLRYDRRQKKLVRVLTEYLQRLNRGEYDLDIASNGEDGFSRLKNEIYRTTVRLREQSERSRQDKLRLQDSISDISHQIKTPLTSISVMLDRFSQDRAMPEEIRRKLLFDMKQSFHYIVSLVQSLLTLSQLDADSIVMKQDSVPAAELFGLCAHKTEILAELGSVAVRMEDCGEIRLTCDRKWMAEAVVNILKNCIEHTSPGGTVTLSAEDNKLYTDLIISDTGCGIPEKELPHIFERFYKGSGSDENSIGIGLSLAKTIIEKNSGTISVSSTVHQGSRFSIRFFHSF